MNRLLGFALGFLLIAPDCPTFAQMAVHSPKGGADNESLVISVTHLDRNENGYLISVEIMNQSKRTLFLPQSAGWPELKYRLQIESLYVEQWSDGKTNLSAIGLKLRSIPPGHGHFSIGPCRDVVSDDDWVRLAPGNHVSDQIQALEPSLPGIGNSVCPMRFAHFSDKLRISVTAFPSAHWRDDKALRVWTELPLLLQDESGNVSLRQKSENLVSCRMFVPQRAERSLENNLACAIDCTRRRRRAVIRVLQP